MRFSRKMRKIARPERTLLRTSKTLERNKTSPGHFLHELNSKLVFSCWAAEDIHSWSNIEKLMWYGVENRQKYLTLRSRNCGRMYSPICTCTGNNKFPFNQYIYHVKLNSAGPVFFSERTWAFSIFVEVNLKKKNKNWIIYGTADATTYEWYSKPPHYF